MTTEAMRVPAAERPTAREAVPVAAAYRVAYAALALGAVIATAFAPPDNAGLALGSFLGEQILRTRAVPLHLGNETFTAAGAYTGGLGWLGGLTLALLARAGGSSALLLATMLATLTAFWFTELQARRNAGQAFALLAVVIAAACALSSLGVAGGIVTAAFAAVLAYVLDRPGPRAAGVATAIALVWCNVAPQGILAPLIAAIRGTTADEKLWSRIAWAGTVLAMFATPAFYHYPLAAFEALRIDRTLGNDVAFHPGQVAPIAYRIGFTLTMLVALSVGLQRERRASISLVLFSALLALMNGAYLVVFGVLTGPVLAGAAAAALARSPRIAIGTPRSNVAAAIAAAGIGAVLAWHLAAPPQPGGYALAAALERDGRPHRVFCYNVDWCDAALAEAPAVRVFVDGRVEAYPQTVLDQQGDIMRLRSHWRKRLNDSRVDTIVAPRSGPFGGILSLWPAWHRAAARDGDGVFERTVAAR
jgi:hypothetical protein